MFYAFPLKLVSLDSYILLQIFLKPIHYWNLLQLFVRLDTKSSAPLYSKFLKIHNNDKSADAHVTMSNYTVLSKVLLDQHGLEHSHVKEPIFVFYFSKHSLSYCILMDEDRFWHFTVWPWIANKWRTISFQYKSKKHSNNFSFLLFKWNLTKQKKYLQCNLVTLPYTFLSNVTVSDCNLWRKT